MSLGFYLYQRPSQIVCPKLPVVFRLGIGSSVFRRLIKETTAGLSDLHHSIVASTGHSKSAEIVLPFRRLASVRYRSRCVKPITLSLSL